MFNNFNNEELKKFLEMLTIVLTLWSFSPFLGVAAFATAIYLLISE